MNAVAATLYGLLIGTGGLFVALALPLAKGSVPPNGLYGFRTRATLENPDIWYPVNRVTGWWLAVVGLAMMLAAAIAWAAGMPPVLGATVIGCADMAGLLAVTVYGTLMGARLKRDKTT